MPKLYTTKQIRAIEAQIMQNMAEWDLMQQAADAVYRFIRRYYPYSSKYICMIGGGNNGGDALTIAALLKEAGKRVEVRILSHRDKLTGSAAKAMEKAESVGLDLLDFDCNVIEPADALIIDGLLGIGLSTPCREPALKAIQWINQQSCDVVAVDLPSGLNADTGCVMGAAVKANYTVTLIGAKIGLYMGDGPDQSGEIHIASLNADKILSENPATANTLPLPDYGFLARKKNTHKGSFGHVLIVGGNEGMAGAVALASLAALRTGAGLVSAVVRRINMTAVLPVVPEVMVYGMDEPKIPDHLLNHSKVIVIGPGLGNDDWARQCFNQVMKTDTLKVIDASALHLLAQTELKPFKHQILTPHPGEAGSLLGITASDVQSDRVHHLQEIQTKYGGVCVLKGVGTLISDGNKISLCQHGNPGMATAGMGDVLSGIIAALLAQGNELSQAAQQGVLLHALAGDHAANQYGEVSMVARDVIEMISICIKEHR